MRLIDAPIGIFRFDGELVLKTEYYSEDKQSGKYIPDCYIIRTGEYFWGGAKTANELINLDIEPVDFAELLPTVTDTISRQAAIDALTEDEYREFWDCIDSSVAADIIRRLPSAQPEIIRCKNCKWRMSENRKATSLWLPCRALVTPDEFSCIYAERRTK